MGKYTSLAHKIRSREPGLTEEGKRNKVVKVVPDDANSGRVGRIESTATTLRPTTLTTLSSRCIHELAEDRCAVCSGYVRWLIAGGDARLNQALKDPEGTRLEYWKGQEENDEWIVP
jgi:hypothetical protein